MTDSAEYLRHLAEREGITPRVSLAQGEDFSKWLPWSGQAFNYRTIFPNELVFESDFPTPKENQGFTREVSKRLRVKGMTYSVWFTGSRSFHIHKFAYSLAELPDDHRTRAKKAFALDLLGPKLIKQCDPANFFAVRLIAAEYAPSRKTGKPKTLVETFPANMDPLALHANVFPLAIIERTRHVPASYPPSTKNPHLLDCPLCLFAMRSPIPAGGRHMVLLPNFLALTPSESDINTLAQTQQMPLSEITGWRASTKWRGIFSCMQLRRWANEKGLRRICDACLLSQKYVQRRF